MIVEKGINGTALPAGIGTAVVLGSGLSCAEGLVRPGRVIPYADVPGFEAPSVEGHPGRILVEGEGANGIAFLAGRYHMYEGGGMRKAGGAVSLAGMMGCRRVILTHAAGSLGRGLEPGSWMLASDIVSFPTRDPGSETGIPRLPLVSEGLGREIASAALGAGVKLHEGILFWTPGPAFETPAEALAAVELGADAATMSPLPELLEASRLGIEAACLGWITNYTPNVSGDGAAHVDVLRMGRDGAGTLIRIIRALMRARRRA